MQWYRIVQNKDGSIASCVESEHGTDDKGRRVSYVEASSKESAIAILAAVYRKKKDQLKKAEKSREAAHDAAGLCRLCSRPKDGGTKLCIKHRQRARENARRGRGDLSKARPEAVTPEQQALAVSVSREADRIRTATSGSLYVKRKYLLQTQRMYENDPENFANWLAIELQKITEAIESSRELASAKVRRMRENAMQAAQAAE